MFSGYKTYAVVVGGLVTVVGMFLSGDLSVAEAINQVLVLLGVGTLRAGVSSSK